MKTEFLTDYIDQVYLPGITSGTIMHEQKGRPKRFAAHTVRSVNTIAKALRNYETDTRHRIRFTEINDALRKDLLKWAAGKAYMTNYIDRLQRNIKSIARYAYREGVHDSRIEPGALKSMKEETPKVYLTDSELAAIMNAQLSKHLNHYRDIMILSALTALRYSDVYDIRPEHITEKEGVTYLQKHQKKTDDPVMIPLTPDALVIIRQPGFFARSQRTNPAVNRAIKEIGKLAGIDTPVEVRKTIKGRSVYTTRPKYELITLHTLRRTAATRLYLMGVHDRDIMILTGHRKPESLQTYIQADSLQRAQRLANNPEFMKRIQ